MNDTSKANLVFAVLAAAFLFICAAEPVIKIAAELSARNLLPFLAHKQETVVKEPFYPLPAPASYIKENNDVKTAAYKPEKTIRDVVAEAKASNAKGVKARPLPIPAVFNVFKDKIDQLKGVAVVHVQNSFAYKNEFSDLNMFFRKALGMKMPMSAEGENLVVMTDGHMVYKNLRPAKISSYYDANVAVIKAVHDEAVKAGTKMLFVIRPDKMLLTDEKEYSIRAKTYENELKTLGIPVLNVSEKFDALPEKDALFLLSDHHWNARGAMLGASMLAEELNKNYGFSYDLEYFNPEHFKEVTFKKAAIGSLGKKVSSAYLKRNSLSDKGEDVSYFIPTFKTSFQLDLPFQNAVLTGDFSTLLHVDELDQNLSFYDRVCYTYLFSDASILTIRNTQTADRKKILMIQDSYSRPGNVYLALQTYEVCAVDTRYEACPDILSFIRSYKPDAVIFIYNPDVIVQDSVFSWKDREFHNGKSVSF